MAAIADFVVTRVANRRRWVVWGSVSASLFLSFFHRVVPAVIADRLVVDFGVGGAALGALSSIYFYVYMAMQVPTGLLADTLGVRRIVTAGSLVAGTGGLVFALAPNLTVAFVGRFLVGLGTAVAFISMLKIVTGWFRPSEFATLAGLGAIVSSAGSVAAATPLAAATEAFGWRAALAAMASLSLGVAALAWWQVRDRPPGEPRADPPPLRLRRAVAAVWGNRQTWFCFTAHFGWFGAYLAFVGLWGVPYLMHVHRLNRVQAANLMMGVSVAYTAGALGLGVISDRWRRRKAPMLAAGLVFLASWVALVSWPGGRPPTAVTVGAILIGCAASSANLLCLALVKEWNPPEAAGLAMASANGGILCAALLQPMIGAILDLGWRGEVLAGARLYDPFAYQLGFAAFVACGVVALVGVLLARESRCRNMWPGGPRP